MIDAKTVRDEYLSHKTREFDSDFSALNYAQDFLFSHSSKIQFCYCHEREATFTVSGGSAYAVLYECMDKKINPDVWAEDMIGHVNMKIRLIEKKRYEIRLECIFNTENGMETQSALVNFSKMAALSQYSSDAE